MSECYIQEASGPCTCDNCGWKGDAGELEMIRDIEQRLTPGSIVPAGQCPLEGCGALCYQDKPEYDPVMQAVTPLVDMLLKALPYVEDAEDSPDFKKGVVKRDVKAIRDLLAKVDATRKEVIVTDAKGNIDVVATVGANRAGGVS